MACACGLDLMSPKMPDHDVQVAHRTEAPAQLPQHLREGLEMFIGKNGPEQIERRLESPGRDAGLMDRRGIPELPSSPSVHMPAQFLDQFVDVGEQWEAIILSYLRHIGTIVRGSAVPATARRLLLPRRDEGRRRMLGA